MYKSKSLSIPKVSSVPFCIDSFKYFTSFLGFCPLNRMSISLTLSKNCRPKEGLSGIATPFKTASISVRSSFVFVAKAPTFPTIFLASLRVNRTTWSSAAS